MTVKVSVSPSGEASTETERVAAQQQQDTQDTKPIGSDSQIKAGKRPTAVTVGGTPENPDSMLSSARTNSGAAPVEITEKSIVTVKDGNGNAFETSAASAASLGYLRMENGHYVETVKAKQMYGQQPNTSPEASEGDQEAADQDDNSDQDNGQEDENIVHFSPEQDEFVNAVQAGVGDGKFTQVVNQLTASSGEVSEEELRNIARSCGIDQEEDFQSFADGCDSIVESYQNAMGSYCESQGVNADDFYTWIWENNPSQMLHSKLTEYAYTRDPKIYNDLIRSYKQKRR